jgi:hypothetical protein
LEGKLVRLTIAVEEPAPGLTVTRNGQEVQAASFGVSTPVDPGEITVTATAPDHESFSQKIVVGAGNNPARLTIPALSKIVGEPAAVPPAPPVAPLQEAAPPPTAVPAVQPDETEPRSNWTTLHTVGAVTGGVGLVGMGVAGVLTLAANSAWKSANCPNGACATPEDQDRAETAKTQADLATVMVIAGGVATVAGLSLVLFAPRGSESVATRVSVTPLATAKGGGVLLGGQF